MANAIHVWGIARTSGARVLLRIEDHDRQRSRPEYDAALLADLAWLGFTADEGPVRQTDEPAFSAYEGAASALRGAGLVYACDCSRARFDAAAWSGPACPGRCAERRLRENPGVALRVALGGGDEAWTDGIAGARSGPVASRGDLVIRDRNGNWTYGFAVVVDDRRQEVDLVVRGRDLLDATPVQIRLGRALGRDRPPAFFHHGLIRKPSGAKLSKAEGDTSVRELRDAGIRPEALIGRAAAAVGLVDGDRPIAAGEVQQLFGRG